MTYGYLERVVRFILFEYDRPVKFRLEDCLPLFKDWYREVYDQMVSAAPVDTELKSFDSMYKEKKDKVVNGEDDELETKFLGWIAERKVSQVCAAMCAYFEYEEGVAQLHTELEQKYGVALPTIVALG